MSTGVYSSVYCVRGRLTNLAWKDDKSCSRLAPPSAATLIEAIPMSAHCQAYHHLSSCQYAQFLHSLRKMLPLRSGWFRTSRAKSGEGSCVRRNLAGCHSKTWSSAIVIVWKAYWSCCPRDIRERDRRDRRRGEERR